MGIIMDLMRQIDTTIKPEWDNIKGKENVLVEDCEPNMLIGWTDKNPSIWDVSGEPNKPTLENILVALCRRKKECPYCHKFFDPGNFKQYHGDNCKMKPDYENMVRIENADKNYQIKSISGKIKKSL
jgi:hypothetical protein